MKTTQTLETFDLVSEYCSLQNVQTLHGIHVVLLSRGFRHTGRQKRMDARVGAAGPVTQGGSNSGATAVLIWNPTLLM